MKILATCLAIAILFSCKKDSNRFDVDVSGENISVKMIDISKDLYDVTLPFDSLKSRYPFMFDAQVSDETYQKQRTDSLELLIYKEIQAKISLDTVRQELIEMAKHIKYYYPEFESPSVYTFSSVFDENYKTQTVVYYNEYNTFIIALDFFLGAESDFYKAFKVDNYMRESMNPENIVPKTSMAIGETMPLMDVQNNQFLNYIITYGKVMLLQDAFLPGYSDALKIGYTQEEIEWCYANEKNMWDYLIQQDYLFSDDKDLLRRFINPGPFSKFYIMDENNESVDINSPGGVGKWIGWQILRKYADRHPDKSIAEIMANRNFEEIFKESGYQP